MRAMLTTIVLRTGLLVFVLGFICVYGNAQKGEGKKPSIFASCVAQSVLTVGNRHEFVSNGQIKYRIFDGGIPNTSQAREKMKTLVLFSNIGTRSIVASTTEGPDHVIVVGRFFDSFELRHGSWTAIDAEGGPGTADATAEFVQKLTREVPVARTRLHKIPLEDCRVDD